MESAQAKAIAECSAPLLKALDGLPIDEYIAQPRFSRKVIYQSEVAGREITASFAVAGSQDSNSPTFIYVGGTIGGRLHGLFVDWLLQVKGVRGIFVDRPGLGLFTSVRMEQRTAVWLEAVPLILQDVGAATVCLAALSGGAPYVFNFLWHHPELVRQDVPIFLISPWVHPDHSGVSFAYWMSWIPASLTRGVGRIATMTFRRLLQSIASKMRLVGHEANVPATCGESVEETIEHRAQYGKKIFSEAMSGALEDFLLGIKDPTHTWGVCADYQSFANQLAQRCQETGSRIAIRSWFAADDPYLGEKGMKYFIDVFGSDAARAGIDHESEILEEVSHENICYPEMGVIGQMIDLAARKASA